MFNVINSPHTLNNNNHTVIVRDIPAFYAFERTKKGTRIDAFIADFISAMNKRKISTVVSCSGLKMDHITGGGPFAYVGISIRKRELSKLDKLFFMAGWAKRSYNLLDGRVYYYMYHDAEDAFHNKYSDNNTILRWLDLFTQFHIQFKE